MILKNWFNKNPENNSQNKVKIKRQLKDVKAGDRLNVTINGEAYTVECYTNEPDTKTICIIVKYKSFSKHEVYDYDNSRFKNFTLLNNDFQQNSIKNILKEKIQEFEKENKFENCEIIKKAIEIL